MNFPKWNAVIENNSEKQKIYSVLNSISNQLLLTKEKLVPDLLSGKAGIAIYWKYYSLLFPINSSQTRSDKLLNESLQAIADVPLNHTFCSGISGILWGLCHLVEIGNVDCDIEQIIGSEIDTLLMEVSLSDLRRGNYDYLHGGIGSAIYFISKRNNEFAQVALKKIITQIEKLAIQFDEGIAWRDINNKETEAYNLGLSHGIPSILLIITRVIQLGIDVDKNLELLKNSVKWMLTKKNADRTICVFPNSITNSVPDGSRLGWCYGDLGISIALYQMGLVSGIKEWQNEAIEIALFSTNRTNLADNSVKDSGLCHGTASIAHIYNRFYNYTGIQKFKDASQYWHLQTIAFFDSPVGLRKCSKIPNSDQNEWLEDNGLLEGIAGVGLSLISAISSIEPKWDRCLLLS